MTLSGPTNATLKSDANTATATINDDDALPVLSIADATAVAEGEAAQFVVTLAPASGKQVTVSYSTADGTAKASEDYTAASSTTLTFAADETTKTVSVATTEDTRNEATEAFTMTLSGPTNATLKSDANTATATINDDDALPVLSIADATAVAEGEAAQFVVTLAPASSKQVTVSLFDGRRHGEGVGGLHGGLEHDADVCAGRDDEDGLGGDDRGHQERGHGSVHDDPERADERHAEVRREHGDGNDQRRRRDCRLSIARRPWMRVRRRVRGDAGAGERQAGDSVAIRDGRRHGEGVGGLHGGLEHDVDLHCGRHDQDRLGGDDRGHQERATEAFTMTLSGPTNATLKSDANTATATINDDDALPQLSIAGATVDEGDTAQFVVTLAPASGKQVTVSYTTTDGTAKAPEDYTAASSTTLTFTAGDTTKTVSVATTEDTRNEATEAFTMTLSGPTNATLKSDAKTATGTINDDDALPQLSIAGATVDEGDTAQFVVTLAPASGKQVTVSYATADGTAKASEDYTAASSTTLTFAADETTKTISVATTEDTQQRGHRSVHDDAERADERHAEVRREDGDGNHQRR